MTESKKIFIFDAVSGMTLAEDVTLPNGHLVISAGTTLDYALIQKLSDYHILEIIVYSDSDTDLTATEPLPAVPVEEENMLYFERIKSRDDFKIFHKDYLALAETMKSNLNDIVHNNTPVEPDVLLKKTRELIRESRCSLHLFDMLHSMREFDDLTYIHCVNVSLICSVMGQWLGFSQEDTDTLALAGLLHDIGKLLTPNGILTKPDRLTPNEYSIMKKHSDFGYDALKDQGIDIRIKEACLYHHERCDGSGYPEGLKADKIPEFAKIVAIADVYDAMTSKRVYRKALCPFSVVQTLEEECYDKFEPKYLVPFLHNVVSSYLHTNVRLSNDRTGEVIMINHNDLARPVVKLSKEHYIDLSIFRDVHIVEMI